MAREVKKIPAVAFQLEVQVWPAGAAAIAGRWEQTQPETEGCSKTRARTLQLVQRHARGVTHLAFFVSQSACAHSPKCGAAPHLPASSASARTRALPFPCHAQISRFPPSASRFLQVIIRSSELSVPPSQQVLLTSQIPRPRTPPVSAPPNVTTRF